MTQITPVPDYLRQCAETHPPDPALLDSLAKDYLGADGEFNSLVLRRSLISAVARAMNPGCEIQSACVLVGLPGIGKKSFWECLGKHWYDRIKSPADKNPLWTKDELLQVHSSWIVNWDAVGMMSTGNQDLLSATGLIVAPVGTFRPPFESRARQLPRPSIIVGTADLSDQQPRAISSPRLRVIPVCQEIPIDRLEKERDRIWAAATHAYLDGEGWTT